MPNLFDQHDYQVFVQRLDALSADSIPKWGKMTAAQMLAHCTEVQDACNGVPLQKTPFMIRLLGGMIKKMVLSDKPYSKGSATHPQYIINDERDFEAEKERFLASLQVFVDNQAPVRHTLFGVLSPAERNAIIYKHHAHHWEQFGL